MFEEIREFLNLSPMLISPNSFSTEGVISLTAKIFSTFPRNSESDIQILLTKYARISQLTLLKVIYSSWHLLHFTWVSRISALSETINVRAILTSLMLLTLSWGGKKLNDSLTKKNRQHYVFSQTWQILLSKVQPPPAFIVIDGTYCFGGKF